MYYTYIKINELEFMVNKNKNRSKFIKYNKDKEIKK